MVVSLFSTNFFAFFCRNKYVFSKFSEYLSINVFTDFPTFFHCHDFFFGDDYMVQTDMPIDKPTVLGVLSG